MGRSINASSADFRRATAEWLTHLATHASLRDNTFQISQGATTSCEDRVSLALNDMKKARLVADIESGAYDQRLPDLITLARGMFRLDKLETIARHKASTLRFIDEIEVYLAYQVKLRERLNLPTDIADMRYFGVSNVTERDLDAAEASIRAAGPNEMIDYLSIDWSPWESVLRRLEPSQYEEAKARLHEVTENEFEGRLAKRLKRSDEATLANDIDAQVQAGPSIMKEIRREIMGPLTRSFLETRNLMGLLQ